MEIPIQRETTIRKIPASGLCWIVSFLIGLYLRLETESEKYTFAEIIGGLPEIDRKFVEWIRNGSFVQKSIDWTKGSFQDSPLYPLIDALKNAVMTHSQYLLDGVIADYSIDPELRYCIPEDWVNDFQRQATRYGYPLTVRIVQKFFESNGLKTNVVMFGDVVRVRSFKQEGFMHCRNFDEEAPTIAIYFTGNHFDLLTEHPMIVNDILKCLDQCNEHSHSEPPPPPPRSEESETNSMVEDLLRQLEEQRSRAADAELRAIQADRRVNEIERNADERVAKATSHAEQAERVMQEALDESERRAVEIKKLKAENTGLKNNVSRLSDLLEQANSACAKFYKSMR